MAITLDGWKGLSMAVFTIVSLIGAFAAIVLKNRAKQIYVTTGVLFSAGVLIAGGIVHQLAEANEQFEALLDDDDHDDHGDSHDHAGHDHEEFVDDHEGHDHDHDHDHEGHNHFRRILHGDADEPYQWAFMISASTFVLLLCFELYVSKWLTGYMAKKNDRKEEGREVEMKVKEDPVGDAGDANVADAHEGVAVEESAVNAEAPDDHGEGCHDHLDMAEYKENPFSAVLLTLAMSIHSIIEGIGIGAQQTIAGISSAFVAIALHKGFVAFALADGLINAGYLTKGDRKYFFLGMGTFIGVAVLGIGIGWAISSGGNSMTAAVFTSITSGTFIYCAVMEIIPAEIHTIKSNNLAITPCVLMFCVGFALMSVLGKWA